MRLTIKCKFPNKGNIVRSSVKSSKSRECNISSRSHRSWNASRVFTEVRVSSPPVSCPILPCLSLIFLIPNERKDREGLAKRSGPVRRRFDDQPEIIPKVSVSHRGEWSCVPLSRNRVPYVLFPVCVHVCLCVCVSLVFAFLLLITDNKHSLSSWSS